MDNFCYRDLIMQWQDGITIGGIRLDEIIKKFPTLVFIYDLGIIEKKYQMLRKRLPKNVKIFYALKANGNLAVAEKLAKLGCGVDIASEGEFSIAKKAGFKEIIFSGPGKQEHEITHAGGIQSYHVESLEEARKIARLLPGQKIGIRVNTSFEVKNGVFSTTGGPQKFGIDEEKIVKTIKEIRKLNLKVAGIHCYAASGVLDVELLIKNIDHIAKIVEKVERELGMTFEYVDIGGGLGIPYNDKKPVDIDKFCKHASEFAGGREVWIELGRFLVAESGIFVMKVIEIKESRGQKIAISDAGINNLLRPALYGAHPIIAIKAPTVKEEEYYVGGPLCTPMDFFGKNVKLPELEIGDELAVLNTGAYGFSQSMPFFLGHPIAGEVAVEDGKIIKARKNIPAKEYLRWLE